ncbi:sulfate transporter CysZ [Paraneptunicella aestuarii]|uniref:sulfate transporter CysZ n=1 Tax=Paraneptunicella aestuarii TaxID=2831148 RepID=UPI001E5B6A83|nr:sulfate transporter CysZ [Paraneptunicella aestuarii]UAA40512.1 sulfate transporter CysZ [Paraneptunicella aestuarii]
MQANSGAGYFLLGFKLIQTKGIRRFVFIPLFVNILLFGAAFTYLVGRIDELVLYLIDLIPSWLEWLKDAVAYFVWPLAVITILLVSAYLFSTLANWIAAPFNGLLAEKMELLLTGKPLDDGSFATLIKDIPRTLSREFTKLRYYLPRAIGFLILFFFLPVIGQVLWFLFSAWMMAVQYLDYPYDNHKVSFAEMRRDLLRHKGDSFSFGTIVMLFSMIPIINFLVMPVAICGATAMWVDKYRSDYTKS